MRTPGSDIFLLLVVFFLSSALSTGAWQCFCAEGEQCMIQKTNSSGTYTYRQWCQKGCCQNQQQEDTCCQDDHHRYGSVYGIIIVVGMIVVAFCIYIRMKSYTNNKVQQPGQAPPSAVSQSVPETSPAEMDLPPPYWMCVNEVPPFADVSLTDNSATSGAHDDPAQESRPSVVFRTRHLSILSEETPQAVHSQSSSSLTETQMNSTDSISSTSQDSNSSSLQPNRSGGMRAHWQKVILQAASLARPSENSSSGSRSLGRDDEPFRDVRLRAVPSSEDDEMAIIFLQGQLQSDSQQKSSGDLDGNFCKATDRTSSFVQLNVAGPAVDVLANYATYSTGADTAKSADSSSHCGGSDNDGSRSIVPSSVVTSSSLSEILKQLPPGSVVVYHQNKTEK